MKNPIETIRALAGKTPEVLRYGQKTRVLAETVDRCLESLADEGIESFTEAVADLMGEIEVPPKRSPEDSFRDFLKAVEDLD